MTIQLDHTIVPARDKIAAAAFFAEIFGLTVTPGHGYFTQVRVNEALTLDFADDPDVGGGFGHHYAFHVTDEEFDAIFGRLQAKKMAYGSGPGSQDDMQINSRRGGRGLYFRDPNGHSLELMTRV